MKPRSCSCWPKKSQTTAAPVQKCTDVLKKKYPFPLKWTANQIRFSKRKNSKPRGRNWRFDFLNTPMIVAVETAGVWKPDCVQITGFKHASVHAHFGLQPAISIEYYLLGGFLEANSNSPPPHHRYPYHCPTHELSSEKLHWHDDMTCSWAKTEQ